MYGVRCVNTATHAAPVQNPGRHVLSGEVCYVRTWPVLLEYLQAQFESASVPTEANPRVHS